MEDIGTYTFNLKDIAQPLEIKYNWLYTESYCNSSNKLLEKGKYKTNFTQIFYESRGKKQVDSEHVTKTFEIYFDVK